MQAGTHPDYYSLFPEKGKSTLGIDAVREVSEKLYERARLGGAKVVWIPDAALMTDAAANALLKTLEEPPAQTGSFSPVVNPHGYWRHCAVVVVYTISRHRLNSTQYHGLREK